MSDFEERARAEAESRVAADPTDGAAYDAGFSNGFVDGAQWARTLPFEEVWAARRRVAEAETDGWASQGFVEAFLGELGFTVVEEEA